MDKGQTFEQRMEKELFDRGLFEDEAKQILALAKSDETLKAMDRWGDDVEGYPPQMLGVIWVGVRRIALKWIVENKPLAWYRPLFEDKELQSHG